MTPTKQPERPRGFFERVAPKVLLVFMIATPVLFYCAARSIGTNSNRLADWLPANLEETLALEQFNAWFGDGQFVILSWDGCRVDTSADQSDVSDDPRLARLADILVRNYPPVPDELELIGPTNFDATTESFSPAELSILNDPQRTRYFQKVITSRSLLDTLTTAPLNLSRSEAIKRLTGTVLGSEGQACCVILLKDFPTEELRNAIGFRKARWIDSASSQGLLFRALAACDIPLDRAYLGGPPIDNLSINEEGQRTLVRLGFAAGGLGLLLAWWSLRSVSLTLIVFLCGIISTCGATAAIWLTGCHADAIVLAMPSLIYVLTISGAIHLVNYYREAVQKNGTAGAAGRALAAGYKPAALCSVTTALGLLSLFASDLTPIRRFGIFSAIGMIQMLIVLFLLLPAALEVFGRRRAFGFLASSDHEQASGNGAIERWAERWAYWVIGHYRSIGIAGLILMIGLSCGIGRVHTSVDLLKLFDAETRILADYHHLEDSIGNLVPLEVLVRFDSAAIAVPGQNQKPVDGTLSMLDRAQVVDAIRGKVYAKFGHEGEQLISPPLSAITFLPALPKGNRGTSAVIRNRVTNQRLEESHAALIDSGYLAVDAATRDELWRISLRVAAFKNVDYGLFAEEVKSVVDPFVAEVSARVATRLQADSPPIAAIHTGAIPIVYKAQRELLNSLIESTVWSFLTITPLLMWVTRGVMAGAVAMLPNLLPVLAVFGSMGWLGINVDIGCMMTSSIALGVAVDDTIHFLCWYRHGQETSSTRDGAIASAFRSCCRPTLQAAVVNGLGLSVFLLSTFVPTKQFGLLMLVILSCGAVAELVLLPALLASPLGRAFDIKRISPASTPSTTNMKLHRPRARDRHPQSQKV